MQQPSENLSPSTQDPVAARRLAESNATINHFIGAAPRPWMSSAVPIPSLPTERHVLQPRPTRSPYVADKVSEFHPSGTVQSDTVTEHQVQSMAMSPSVRSHDMLAAIEQPCYMQSGTAAPRSQSSGLDQSPLDTPSQSFLQQTRQPSITSLGPTLSSPESAQAPSAVPDTRLRAGHNTQMIMSSMIHRLNSCVAQIGRLGTIETQRISLLREACVHYDPFFVCLHQIFCVASIDPRRIEITGFAEHQYGGLNLLTWILLPNQNMSAEMVNLFAELPTSLETLLNGPGPYKGFVEQVGVFLRLFAARWHLLRERCLQRKSPPFVDELVEVLEVHSHVMQRVLFNAIHTQLGGREGARWSKKGLTLFDANQDRYRARQRHSENVGATPQSEILKEQKSLAAKYRALCKNGSGSNVENTPAARRVTFVLPNTPLSMMEDGRATHTWSDPRAPALLLQTPSSQQRRDDVQRAGGQNPLSPPQSGNTTLLNAAPAAGGTSIVDSSSRTQSSNLMVPPNLVLPSSQGSMGNQATDLPHHVVPQPSSQRTTGLPSLSSTPVVSHMAAPEAQRGGSGLHVAGGGHVGSHPIADQISSSAVRLIPAPGHEPTRTSSPNPIRLALHQAYLRDPAMVKIDAGRVNAEIRLYQSVRAFAMAPRIIERGSSFLEWEFCITDAVASKKAIDLHGPDGQRERLVSDGSILCRLRSAEVVQPFDTIEDGMWNVKETSWPPYCFVKFNDVNIELRRRLHHGKDLPADLTPHIRVGKNSLTIALLICGEEKAAKRYAMAVEVVEVGDQARIDAEPTRIGVYESLRSITQGLAMPGTGATNEDDEIHIVDSHMSIDLIDPFMATIFDLPARGKTCRHRECFDLQTFFRTRKAEAKDEPTSPDEWKCPICKKDARPQSLVVDCFLKGVRDYLVASGAAAGARAILVSGDGSWHVRTDDGHSRRTKEVSKATATDLPAISTGTLTGNVNRNERTVIEIEDD